MRETKRYTLFILITLFGLLLACTEKFYPEIEADVSILVVDGKITNQPGPYEVRLFRTVDLIEADTLKPETEAIIILNDDLGNSELFEEVKPGVYQTTNKAIKGEVGQSYWINIETKKGLNYESTPEQIPPPYDIQKLYGKEEINIISATEKQKVVNFYFDAKANSQNANYIRWECKESYDWRSPEHLNTEKFTENPRKICFPVTNFPLVNIYNASNLDTKLILKQPTTTIYTNEVKLLYEYLLDITLYSITQDNYVFWKNIKSVNFSEGALYDVIAANINGNIQTCNDTCRTIGYFQATSVDKFQKFFSDDDFSMEFSKYPEECTKIEFRMYPPDPAKYHVLTIKKIDGVPIYISRRKECYECNIAYPINKPSFWP